MSMRIGGLATGLDTDNIIKELMNAQRMPVNQLLQKRQSIEWQRDSYREMNSKFLDYRSNKLTEFRLESTFKAQKTTITGDTTAISATTSGSALTDSLTVKVDALAVAAAKWSSADIRSATDQTFDPLANLKSQEAKLDGSTFSKTHYAIKINGTEVKIDTSADSLGAVMARISQNTNVSAFYDEATGKVSFKSKDTGIVNGVDKDQANITFQDDSNFLSGIFNIDVAGNAASDSTTGSDANVTINGLATTRSSNTFSVSGIEVTMLKATGIEATIQVTNDTDKVVDKIKEFITSYNEMLGALQDKAGESKYRSYQPLTNEQKEAMSDREVELWEEKAMSGLLKNDPILNKAISDMRFAASSQVETGDDAYKTLSSIGITTGAYNERGKLYLVSETKLRAAIEANPDAIAKLFTAAGNGDSDRSDMGIAERMYEDIKISMDRISQKAGTPLSLTDNSFLGKDLERLNTRIDDSNRRLSDVESRYYRQFTAMERAINQLNAQSAYLANAFGGGQQQ
jgi:flagellar hook-associated protein 2